MSDADRRKAILVYLLSTAVLGVVFLFGSPPDRRLFWDSLFDAGHVLLFGTLTWLTLRLARALDPDRRHVNLRAAQVLGAMLLLAPLTEAIQLAQLSRDPSIGDILRDYAGTFAVLLWWWSPSAGVSGEGHRRLHIAIRIGAIAMCLLAMISPIAATAEVYEGRNRALPNLVRLDGSYWEHRLLRVGGGQLIATTANSGRNPTSIEPAILRLQPGTYPGIALSEPYPDWSRYERLVFDVEVRSGAPVTLTIRVHDATHTGSYSDRFNREFILSGGRHTISIALDDIKGAPSRREMDMTRIRGVAVFAWQLTHDVELAVASLRLE